MDSTKTEYLGKHKKFRADFKKLAAAFIALAVIVAIIVFWWLKLVGITVTGDAFCGMNEHTHGENCYVSELICEISEDEITAEDSEGTLPSEEDGTAETADEEETTEAGVSAESHIHSEECYEKVLTCTLKEHTHTSDCYPDFSADVETENDWLATFEDVVLTKNVSENLVNIVKTQLGYAESELNFEYDEEGTKRGYTRYGEWYGNPYGNWNAMFVSFCLSYSNIENAQDLISSGAETMHQQWQKAELFEAADHSAKAGELIFLDTDNDEVTDHVAIISEVSEDEIKVFIGDLNNCVEEINIDDSMVIIGYGLTHKLKTIEEETTTEVETATAPSVTEEATTKSSATTEGDTSATENTVSEKTEEDEHKHTEDCYTFDNILACTEWGKEEPWALDRESEEFRDKAVKYVTYLINQVPVIDEFEKKLNEYDKAEDYDGYEVYYKEIYRIVCKAYVNYENLLLDLRESVPNRDNLFDYEWLYTGTSTMAVTETRTVEFVNYYDNATSYKTVLIHSSNVGAYSSFGFYWWYAVVVDENEYGELVVTNKYGYELTNKSSLKPTTTKGFVLLSHGDANAFDCAIGDEVTVNFDYLNTAAGGSSSSSFGTVTFSDYVPPETTTEPPTTEPEEPDTPVGDPVVEDIPLEDIQDGELSDDQVVDAGGKTTSSEGDVEISKSIDGTDIENVFDITLTVRTETSMQTYLEDPDMAVVIVMDISNTMNADYGSTTRYAAAVTAAENFINQFAEQGKGISKLGFVAFNTHAHEILSMQPCTTDNATTLINTMKSATNTIISASGYADSHDRFTNVEAGLKMGYDMLASSGNENQYIVFLSDGFPTTYYNPYDSANSSSQYRGYDPYTPSGTKGEDGVFYDYVTGYYCSYGTSYSDKASIKARVQATQIKNMGAKIFSIGVDIGGQTISGYETTGLSIIDRTGTTYEIGDASSTQAYKTWLQYSIGSGYDTTNEISYYYDSINQTQITAAFETIFKAISKLNEESRKTIWTTTDPLPVLGEDSTIIEFIHFYDKNDKAVLEPDDPEKLEGNFGIGEENTAYHQDRTIYWDLKGSGYTETKSADGNTTYYHYKIKYRVRLYNENKQFLENNAYITNGDAYLEYKTVVTEDNITTVSDNKTLYFEKPAVLGYVAEFSFTKQSDLGEPLAGAVFELTHDDEACSICHGNGKPVTTVSTLTYTSQADGIVNFTQIPSGHVYTLKETVFPEGYADSGRIYKVTIAMDKLSVMMYKSEEDTVGQLWEGDSDYIITNPPIVYILPETGGPGTLHLTIIGLALMAFPILYSILRRKRERRFN